MSEPTPETDSAPSAMVLGQILITRQIDADGDETILVQNPGVSNIVEALGMLCYGALSIYDAYRNPR